MNGRSLNRLKVGGAGVPNRKVGGGSKQVCRQADQQTMAVRMEEDKLEYDAEVAYITATSPLQVDHNRGSKSSFSEFDFSLEALSDYKHTHVTNGSLSSSQGKVERSPGVDSVDYAPEKDDNSRGLGKTASPKLLVSISSTLSSEALSTAASSLQGSPLSPILTPPHYTLDTSLPSTPKSKLKLIQEAQISPPSPKATTPKFSTRLDRSRYKYKTLVIYGTTGCGKTNLVEKLVHTNPAVFAKVVSHTTRKKRASEVNEVDFHYVSERDMSLGIARGDFLEHIQLRKRQNMKKRRATVFTREPGNPQPRQLKERRLTAPELPGQDQLVPTHRTDSKFDLTEDDSPVVGGEMFGTTKQALTKATQEGKSCVVLNVSFTGAQQLRRGGIEASFVLVHSGTKPPKNDQVNPDYVINSERPNQAYSELQQYAFHLIQDLNLAQTTRYEITKHEWESLPTVEIESNKDLGPRMQVRPVSFSEILTHFQLADLSKEKTLAKADLPKEGGLTRTKLNKKLHEERLLVFGMALRSLTDRDKLHLRTLQTIYTLLTGSSINCRRFGMHWRDIGFNGVDPADDLQGVGVFGLAQLIYFLDNPRTISLAREIFRFSRQEPHIVPFCVLSFNITQIALSALRGGSLTKLANKRDQVIVVVNEFYIATFYRYYLEWKTQNKSILELGPLIQNVGEYSKKHSREIIEDFESYLSKRDDSSHTPSTSLEADYKPFTVLDDYSDV